MTDCLFCQIIDKKIPATIVYEDDNVLALDDIDPQAPCHKLIIPKKHIATINDIDHGNAELVSQLLLAAKEIAADLGHADNGYRIVMNCNADGGQMVFHIHLHLLAGRALTWPPG